ncbi:YwiC-like family protein [Bifidobacterium imperatoris]|uniref:YwiC-like family protein n=2 Tax=Bifidobacterium imperatoris TaxID=2020965 RepID=A0A2N5IT27_9BIFI|nr:YwiC-like protein [Bifidobacterium imperatoris]QSY58811.1 YwiC-like family protein [Bifidobacterium imperatoris]
MQSQPQRIRRATARGWIPDQPGAWVMALAPALAGTICGSVWSITKPDAALSIAGWWILLCWALCYCVEFAAARWLKSHCATRYLPPVIGYCIVLAAVGTPFLIMHIDVLAWAPIYMVLAAMAFAGAWFRRERSLWSNAAAVIAASLMAMIALHYAANSPSVPQVSLPGLVLTLCFAATQFGSVLFVKTMIRERGKRSYVAASWIWHIALLAWWIAAASLSWYLVILGVILLIRAMALPLIARKHTIKPVIVGVTECFTSLIAFGCIIANALIAI